MSRLRLGLWLEVAMSRRASGWGFGVIPGSFAAAFTVISRDYSHESSYSPFRNVCMFIHYCAIEPCRPHV